MTLEDLLPKIACLLQSGGRWHARAQDSDRYVSAVRPIDACRLALELEAPTIEVVAKTVEQTDDNSDLF